MAPHKETKTFQAGDQIIRQGDIADEAYMIISGSVSVQLEKDEKIVDLATLGPNQIFGEKAILEGGKCGANVKALEETQLHVITPESIETMLNNSDPIIQALVSMLVERLSTTNEKFLQSETRQFIDIDFI